MPIIIPTVVGLMIGTIDVVIYPQSLHVGFTAAFAGLCIFTWSKMVKLYESTGT